MNGQARWLLIGLIVGAGALVATLAMVLDYLDPRVASPRHLSDAQVDDLIAFLEALTDPRIETLAQRIPDEVPSGLPVDH